MKNYYGILGVSRQETPAGIRAAYRKAVRRTHPDQAGTPDTAAFQEIVEAHSVLSDPSRRREYDEMLGSYERGLSHAGAVHPIAVERKPSSSLFEDFSSFETFADRLEWIFASRNEVWPERSGILSVEVILTPEEAVYGTVFSIDIPQQAVCGACGGTGSDWFFLCRYCRGEGTVPRVQPVQISLPPFPRLGHRSETCTTLAINDVILTLHIRVSDHYR